MLILRRFFATLKHFTFEWTTALGSTLPNDSISCKLRRVIHNFWGCKIAKTAIISKNVTLLGKIHIGDYSSIANNCIINGVNTGVFIGDYVMIAPNCCLVAFSHGTSCIKTPMTSQELIEKKISISNNVWIGANCTITCGVIISEGAIIGANSVVTKNVPPFTVVGGVPAKVIKKRSHQDYVK